MTSAWCTPPQPLVGRLELLEQARDALSRGPITLVGPAGAGATATACAVVHAAVAAGAVEQLAFVRLTASSEAEDIVLTIGQQVDALLPGDTPSLVERLSERRTAVLLDDADLAPAAARRTASLHAQTLWVATGRAEVLGTPLDVQPLVDSELARLLPPGIDPSPYRGLPLLTVLPVRPTLEAPWRAIDEVPPGAELLFGLPTGLRDSPLPIPAAFLRGVQDRCVPRRAVAEQLGVGGVPSPEALRAALRDQTPLLEGVAMGVLTGTVDDLALFRAGAAAIDDEDLATLAAAAAARLHTTHFQAPAAIEMARAAAARHPDALPGVRALLWWVEGDAWLAQGDEPAADARHRGAAELLRVAGDDPALGLLARAAAAAWASRGDEQAARRWLGVARVLAGRQDPRANAELLRTAGDLAARAGELVGAEALYDHAAADLRGDGDDRQVLAMVLVGKAALSLTRGQMSAGAARLDEAARLAAGSPLVMAAVATRRAELAVRRGKLDEARREVATASSIYRVRGQADALGHVHALLGDVLALAGDRAGAADSYRTALALATRSRDLFAARHAMRRLLAVESEGTPGPHVEEIRQILDNIEVITHARGAGSRGRARPV